MEEILLNDTKSFSNWLQLGFPGIFRGQRDASWPIRPSIERHLSIVAQETEYWITEEYYSIREFQRKAPLYTQHLPKGNDWVSWIAMIQHHGGKTRLIDFTYSRYIAAYFAAIDAVDDFAIWDISDMWIRDLVTNHIAGNVNYLREDALQMQHDAANEFLSTHFKINRGGSPLGEEIECGVFMLEPTWSTSRQSVQQGLFLMPRNIHKGFSENVEGSLAKADGTYYKESTHIRKYTLSYKLREPILGILKEMNITAETLYGGLDGLARAVLHR